MSNNITIAAIPKEFKGHTGIIQRNAIISWTKLSPKPEIILFGNDIGIAEICQELQLRHQKEIKCNEFGTPLLNDMFTKTQLLASHNLICYINSDIILMDDFCSGVANIRNWSKYFLMVGRRWDVDIEEPWDFSEDWQNKIKELAFATNTQRDARWIDYFVFVKGMFPKIPPFAVGRPYWDNWFIWNACAMNFPVIDASKTVVAIHQNHDYSHLPQDQQSALNRHKGMEAQRHNELSGGWLHWYTITDTTHRLTSEKIEINFARWLKKMQRLVLAIWYGCLAITRPIRHSIGLRK